jgi:hypothetical protein
MRVVESAFGIPLPPSRTQPRAGAEAGQAGRLVAEFLGATQALSCQAAAELAGVRTETIRKWRCRLPRALRAATSRRMRAHLAGEPLPAVEEGFRRSFRRVLRNVSGSEPGVTAGTRGGVLKQPVQTPAAAAVGERRPAPHDR